MPTDNSRPARDNPPSAAANAQARRMRDRLDESGAPVNAAPRRGSPPSPPITGAGIGHPMGNAQIDAEAAIQEEIRVKAYERWLSRGGLNGSAQDDWTQAEKEVRGKLWSRAGGPDPAL
jgi:hypothetical protein